MANKNYTYVQTRQPFTLTSVSTAQYTTINMQGFDTLILDIDFTRAAGTATVFTFDGSQPNTSNNYGFTITNYAGGTIADGTFTYTASANYSKRFIFSLTGLGISVGSTGNIRVGIAVTSGTTDAITCTPSVAVTG
jgi:hypothetical protein